MRRKATHAEFALALLKGERPWGRLEFSQLERWVIERDTIRTCNSTLGTNLSSITLFTGCEVEAPDEKEAKVETKTIEDNLNALLRYRGTMGWEMNRILDILAVLVEGNNQPKTVELRPHDKLICRFKIEPGTTAEPPARVLPKLPEGLLWTQNDAGEVIGIADCVFSKDGRLLGLGRGQLFPTFFPVITSERHRLIFAALLQQSKDEAALFAESMRCP